MNQTQTSFSVYRSLIGLIPTEGIVVRAADHDYETGETYRQTKTYAPLEVVRELREAHRFKRQVDIEALSRLRSCEDIKNALAASFEEEGIRVLFIGTPGESEKARIEEERRQLEHRASQIASAHGVRIDSFEFISILEGMIESQKSYREGMREDGLCIGYGVTREQWFDEFNYSQSETSSVRDILSFLESYCPLIMAQHRERALTPEINGEEVAHASAE